MGDEQDGELQDGSVAQRPNGVGDKVDLSGLSFDERLSALSKQYENAVPISPEERKRLESLEPERKRDPDENFWNPLFWAAVKEDLQSVEWPRPKKVWQTLYISQIAFVVVVVLVLFTDALFDSAIKSLFLGEPFSITVSKILKIAATSNQGM